MNCPVCKRPGNGCECIPTYTREENPLDLAIEEMVNLSRLPESEMDRGQWCRLRVARAYVMEVGRSDQLTKALVECSMRTLSDASLCWCKSYDERGPYKGQHADYCIAARTALSRSPGEETKP